jgi:hypothetical protein
VMDAAGRMLGRSTISDCPIVIVMPSGITRAL